MSSMEFGFVQNSPFSHVSPSPGVTGSSDSLRLSRRKRLNFGFIPSQRAGAKPSGPRSGTLSAHSVLRFGGQFLSSSVINRLGPQLPPFSPPISGQICITLQSRLFFSIICPVRSQIFKVHFPCWSAVDGGDRVAVAMDPRSSASRLHGNWHRGDKLRGNDGF